MKNRTFALLAALTMVTVSSTNFASAQSVGKTVSVTSDMTRCLDFGSVQDQLDRRARGQGGYNAMCNAALAGTYPIDEYSEVSLQAFTSSVKNGVVTSTRADGNLNVRVYKVTIEGVAWHIF